MVLPVLVRVLVVWVLVRVMVTRVQVRVLVVLLVLPPSPRRFPPSYSSAAAFVAAAAAVPPSLAVRHRGRLLPRGRGWAGRVRFAGGLSSGPYDPTTCRGGGAALPPVLCRVLLRHRRPVVATAAADAADAAGVPCRHVHARVGLGRRHSRGGSSPAADHRDGEGAGRGHGGTGSSPGVGGGGGVRGGGPVLSAGVRVNRGRCRGRRGPGAVRH